jgi:hypothetical protein
VTTHGVFPFLFTFFFLSVVKEEQGDDGQVVEERPHCLNLLLLLGHDKKNVLFIMKR